MRITVCGAAGFLGRHLVRRLLAQRHEVIAIDRYSFDAPGARVIVADLANEQGCRRALSVPCDRLYQLAAEMGGAGYIFTGANDYQILQSSTATNINVLNCIRRWLGVRVLFASSACVYPIERQSDLSTLSCEEGVAYPANPDSEYGWQKLFSERLFCAFAGETNLQCRIARFHNIYGPDCAWNDGREKAPAALCRKVATAIEGGAVEVWGAGEQTRSFLYVDDCIEAAIELMESDYADPLNIGSSEMITVNELARIIIKLSGKSLTVRNVNGPVGVAYRVSSNLLAEKVLRWRPTTPLVAGLARTYAWIDGQVSQSIRG